MFSKIIRFVPILFILSVVGVVQAQEEPPYVPDELAFDITVQIAYNDNEIFWRFTWEAQNPGYYHDYLVYNDGAWQRRGDSGDGADPNGLREDRVTFMIEPGTIRAFGTQGCYVGCHDGTTSLSSAFTAEQIAASNFTISSNEIRKYILESRNQDGEWWRGDWDNVRPDDELQALREAGVFLDLWHWRAHRSNPIGYSDNQYVLEYRNNDGSRSPFTTNFNSDAGTPNFMFNPEITGFYALNWDALVGGEYSFDDIYYISTDISVEFDPDHAWQNGDTIPRRLLREPDEQSGSVRADGVWENATWTVVLRRSLTDVDETVSHPLVEGRTYNAAFAIHRDAVGSRWHYISQPRTVGIGTPAMLTAVRITGDNPDWDAVPVVSVPVYYPAEITWEWLTSEVHPGAVEVRDNTRSCVSCHGATTNDMIKLSQASVHHERFGSTVQNNWWLTLIALVSVIGGGTFAMLGLFNKRGGQ